jgi:hypothetical protein
MIKNLDIIHFPVLYFKYSISGTGFCPETETSSIDYAQLSRFHLTTETEFNL